jgi:hypothetical protein
MQRPNQFSRTGTVLTSENAKASQELADYAMEKLRQLHPGSTIDFDCLHNNGGGYAVHEFCSALGGVSVRYMNYSMHEHILREAIDSKPSHFVDYATKLKETQNLDKYTLRGITSKYEQVVFLSGSNIMHENIDFDIVAGAVSEGAVIKPHPVTNAKDMEWLRSQFGAENVLGPKVAGAELLKDAFRVYVAKNSELYLLAIAFRKSIRSIGKPGFLPEVYRPVINNIIDHPRYMPVIALNRLLSAPQSGIFFDKEGVDRGLEVYVNRVKELLNDSVHKDQ